jgi:hypothetical protein
MGSTTPPRRYLSSLMLWCGIALSYHITASASSTLETGGVDNTAVMHGTAAELSFDASGH